MNKQPVETSTPAIPKIMVFRPTLEEMKDFSKYIDYMESQGAHHAGLAKIIPPPEWIPRKSGYDNINRIMIREPIEQKVEGGQGMYHLLNMQRRGLSVKEFKKMANSPRYAPPKYFDYAELERIYWKNIPYNPPIYGADLPGTLTDPDCEEFNINKLNTILDMVCTTYGITIKGVNTAYLYFGMWKSTFGWHTEDVDLYSINYLHFGAPKSWYCVPPKYGRKLEKAASEMFRDQYEECPVFLRHKMTMISPQILSKYSIPYLKITQEEREFMITFPYAYHAGYNHGWNCAESTNFAMPRWIEFGKRANLCNCTTDAVKINMDVFVKNFQPERYENWLAGMDIGPDPKDPTNICAAPTPLVQRCLSKTTKSKRQLCHKPEELEGFEFFSENDLKHENDADFVNNNGCKNNFKSKRKKSKLNHTEMITDKINSTNGCDSDNAIVSNDLENDNDGDQSVTKNALELKLQVFDAESFSSNYEPVTSLDELSGRTLQYTENPKAFEDEVKFNYFSSLIEPFCSICILLRLFEFYEDLSKVNLNLKPPKNSQVLIPKSVLISKIKQPIYLDHFINQSDLLICTICKLCVHTTCYGIDEMVDSDQWKCDRCLINDQEAACCLCPLRGGALKMTTCNQWAHLTCAIVLNNIKIENDALMKPIDITAVQPFLDSDRITCCFCLQKSNYGNISNYIIGCCTRCNGGNSCTEHFHVTCAYREGVLFELNDNLTSFKLTCKKCQTIKINRGKEFMHRTVDIEIGMRVIAKYNSHYAFAKVIDKYDELFHHVNFVDNSFANNIRATDILNRDCEKERPMIGDLVEVIWNKEQLHGKYAGCHVSQRYSLLFDNGVQLCLNRDDLFLLNESVPKRVVSKFTNDLKCIE